MTILLLERLHPEAEALLAGAGPVVVSPDPNAPPADLRDVVAIVTPAAAGSGPTSSTAARACA